MTDGQPRGTLLKTTSSPGRAPTALLAGAVIILLLGILLRFYRLDAQKLWLDELYTVELVRAGFEGIWQTAFVDITPPLPNLPFWLAGQIAGLSALNLRLVSAIAAVFALLVYYRYCTLALGDDAALIATGLLAIAPLAVYYAQEARPYALGLLGVVMTLWAYQRVRRHDRLFDWVLYAVLATIASHLYYLNIALVGGQLLALLILSSDRKRVLLGGALTVGLVLLTLGPFAIGASQVMSNWKHASSTLDLLSTTKTMLAGDYRISPPTARTAALAVVATGFGLALLNRRTWRKLLPHALQIAIAILLAFGLLPLLGRPVPTYDERAFLMLLPSALAAFSIGVTPYLKHWAGRLLIITLIVILGLTSLTGLSNYFGTFVKSPEGELVEAVAPRFQTGDQAITNVDAYSVDAALRFYQPDVPVYRYFPGEEGQRTLVYGPPLLYIQWDDRQETELDELKLGERLWLMWRSAPPPFYEELLTQYRVREEYALPPFHAVLLERP